MSATNDKETKDGKWTYGIDTSQGNPFIWFERNSDGTGGNLYVERQNEKLVAYDYDGVYELPKSLIEAFTQEGIDLTNVLVEDEE